MPREKYAKITSLDKLHRRQKAAVRKERMLFTLLSNPKTALLTRITGEFSALRAQRMTSEQATSHTPTPTPSSTTASSPILSKLAVISNLPFKISRTPSSNLPVYESTKSGGSKHITTIRKITGDLEQLAGQVRKALGMDQYITDIRGRRKETVTINRTTKQIVVRGWRAPEIKKWAELNGF
ncbi:54S ribosomal protein img2, mitochondrial [Knufia peltigerae]|uniref:Large ribosomal subunit protein mL49 n=1 Tax=Knufia peltigerae TaxID=1002370 RepID=A0AA38XT89_9EURO|nr:54S ribosomal protein img2, mitochondrial [Knufia peltigerae]